MQWRAVTSHQCGPGWIPGLSIICGLSLLLVLILASRGSKRQKKKIQKANSEEGGGGGGRGGVKNHLRWTKTKFYTYFPLPRPNYKIEMFCSSHISHSDTDAKQLTNLWCKAMILHLTSLLFL